MSCLNIDALARSLFASNCEFRNSGIANYVYKLAILSITQIMSFSAYCETIDIDGRLS